MKLGYDWRPDGLFLVRIQCPSCEEFYDVVALANAKADHRCEACQQVEKWIDEAGSKQP
jgi:hypothetical protein